MKILEKIKEIKEKRAKEEQAKELAKLEKANGKPTTEKQVPAIAKKKRKVNPNFKKNVKGK